MHCNKNPDPESWRLGGRGVNSNKKMKLFCSFKYAKKRSAGNLVQFKTRLIEYDC